ncbi:cupin domain-containing protein [Variovorax rhizosphaerae]|uniref:Cupin domain-containing protein n=1 Tax=Variovorax rhizosphaerae TaxID=1836200 RepID=A0ABU8WLY3_9BURK
MVADRFLAVATAILFSFAVQAPAQTSLVPGNVKELARADLSGAPDMEVITSRIEWKPGESVSRHIHPGIETGVVLQGAMIQPPGKEPVMFPTGAPLMNLRGVAHGGFAVVGDTSLILLTVHIVDKGKPVYQPPN